jgi:hypothetical protein
MPFCVRKISVIAIKKASLVGANEQEKVRCGGHLGNLAEIIIIVRSAALRGRPTWNSRIIMTNDLMLSRTFVLVFDLFMMLWRSEAGGRGKLTQNEREIKRVNLSLSLSGHCH